MKLKELGTLLQEERLKQGLSLDDIKEKTKLSEYILQAIENGDASRLPVEVYAKSFIKSYIKELGLDSQEIKEELDELFPAASLEFSSVELRSVMTPLPSANQSLKLIFVVFLTFLLLGLGLWFGVSSMKEKWSKKQDLEENSVQQETGVDDDSVFFDGQKENFGKPDVIEDDPEDAAEQKQQAEPAVLEKKEKKHTEKETLKSAKREKKIFQPVPEGTEKVADKPEQAVVALQTTESGSLPQKLSSVEGESQVFRLEATGGECWTRAEIDGQVIEKYLYPGQSTSFSFAWKLHLKVGNATVVKAFLNGDPYEISGRGQVRVVEILAEQ